MSIPTTKNCALCRTVYEPDEESHIVPAFVYRWLKASSTTGFMRFGPQINQRAQDGIKNYFLCRSCEDHFEKHETKFAAEVFHPFVQDNSHSMDYDEYLLKFAVSVSWRVLAYNKAKWGLKHFRERHGLAVEKTLSVWTDYLLDRTGDIGSHEIHLLPFCGVVDHMTVDVPKNIKNSYEKNLARFEHSDTYLAVLLDLELQQKNKT